MSFWTLVRLVTCIVIGCGGNIIFLELLLSHDIHASKHLVPFQFFMVACYAFPSQWQSNSLIKTKMPIHKHAFLAFLYFLVNQLNVAAFAFEISVPMNLIFRSSSLIATLLVSMYVFKKSYSRKRIFGVILVSIGVFLATSSDGYLKNNTCCDTPHWQNLDESTWSPSFMRWLSGLGMLTGCMFFQAWMGIYQSKLGERYGDVWQESLFYTHALAIPLFLSVTTPTTLMTVANEWYMSPSLLSNGIHIPICWVYVLGNNLCQVLCIRNVFQLIHETSSLTCTFTLTVRKFLSVVISVVYFSNPFTIFHWIGAILVSIGSIFYSIY